MKKPFYKQVWFIVVMAIVGLGIIGAIIGEDEPVETSAEQQKDDEPKEVEQPKEEEPVELTPAEKLEEAINKQVKNAEILSVNGVFVEEPFFMQIEMKGKENLTNNMTIKGMKMAIRDAVYAIKESGYEIENLGVSVKYPLVDQYGNSSDEYVIKSDFTNETINKLNENKNAIDLDNLSVIADNWWEHPALNN